MGELPCLTFRATSHLSTLGRTSGFQLHRNGDDLAPVRSVDVGSERTEEQRRRQVAPHQIKTAVIVSNFEKREAG